MRSKIRDLTLIFGITLLIIFFCELGLRLMAFEEKTVQDTAVAQLIRKGADRYSEWRASLEPDEGTYGKDLNHRAWEASFAERGVKPPHFKPREGYWGLNMEPKVGRLGLQYTERELDFPGLVRVDWEGFQEAGVTDDPDVTILIHGGSVAFGAYASINANTYFSVLADLLAERGIRARIYVLAASGWSSYDELLAFVLKGLNKDPDIVVFLDGLNDMTNIDDRYEYRVNEYLEHMEKAKNIAGTYGIEIVYALQPFLPYKKRKTVLEQQILGLDEKLLAITPWYRTMARELEELTGPGAHVIDCSSVLSDEPYTTFADQWHFSDAGHRLVGQRLAEGLVPIIAGLDRRPGQGHLAEEGGSAGPDVYRDIMAN